MPKPAILTDFKPACANASQGKTSAGELRTMRGDLESHNVVIVFAVICVYQMLLVPSIS